MLEIVKREDKFCSIAIGQKKYLNSIFKGSHDKQPVGGRWFDGPIVLCFALANKFKE